MRYVYIIYKQLFVQTVRKKNKSIGTVQISSLQKLSLCQAWVKKIKYRYWKTTKGRSDRAGWRVLNAQITGTTPAARANCLDYNVSTYADRLPACWAQN